MDALEDRFWAKVAKDDDADCWIWTACVVRRYGQFSVGERKRARAHRFAYELLVGPIPEGAQLDHLCRNPLCVNPDHLEPVTPRENTLRGNGVTAINARKTHCKHGHAFSPENVYQRKGARSCRTCQRLRLRLLRQTAA